MVVTILPFKIIFFALLVIVKVDVVLGYKDFTCKDNENFVPDSGVCEQSPEDHRLEIKEKIEEILSSLPADKKVIICTNICALSTPCKVTSGTPLFKKNESKKNTLNSNIEPADRNYTEWPRLKIQKSIDMSSLCFDSEKVVWVFSFDQPEFSYVQTLNKRHKEDGEDGKFDLDISIQENVVSSQCDYVIDGYVLDAHSFSEQSFTVTDLWNKTTRTTYSSFTKPTLLIFGGGVCTVNLNDVVGSLITNSKLIDETKTFNTIYSNFKICPYVSFYYKMFSTRINKTLPRLLREQCPSFIKTPVDRNKQYQTRDHNGFVDTTRLWVQSATCNKAESLVKAVNSLVQQGVLSKDPTKNLLITHGCFPADLPMLRIDLGLGISLDNEALLPADIKRLWDENVDPHINSKDLQADFLGGLIPEISHESYIQCTDNKPKIWVGKQLESEKIARISGDVLGLLNGIYELLSEFANQ